MDANVTNDVPLLSVIKLQDYIDKYIPVSVFLAILSVIGTIGNAHTVFVYFFRYKPSNYRTFVVCLAVVDFVACCFGIPFELLDIRFSGMFIIDTIDGICRFYRCFAHFICICSGLLLCVIAVERFRKACRPHDRQLEGNGAMIACIATVAVSAVLSIPTLVMYGVQVEIADNYNINYTDCTALDKYKDNLKEYNLVLLSICTIVFIACVIIYICIGRVLYQQYTFRSALQIKKSVPTMSENQTVSSDVNITANVHEDESSLGNAAMSRTNISDQDGDKPMKTKQKNRSDKSKRITLMFLVAAGVSYLAYLPYTIITIINASTNSSAAIDRVLGQFYFMSNVTNPLVYGFFDDKFRNECKTFYKLIAARIGKCLHR